MAAILSLPATIFNVHYPVMIIGPGMALNCFDYGSTITIRHVLLDFECCGTHLLRKNLTGVCSPGFCNHTLGYRERRTKSYPWLWKMCQNQTPDNRKYHQINHFWSNFAWSWSNLAQILSFASKKMAKLGQNGQNLLKIYPWLRSLSENQTLGYGNLAKNRPLATEIGLKKGPLRAAHPQEGPHNKACIRHRSYFLFVLPTPDLPTIIYKLASGKWYV